MSSRPSAVQGGSGKPAARSPRAHGEVAKEGRQGNGGSQNHILGGKVKEETLFSPEGQAQGDPRAVFRHLKRCHREEGQSLLCGLKGSNWDQPVEVTIGRFQEGTDRILSAEATKEGLVRR